MAIPLQGCASDRKIPEALQASLLPGAAIARGLFR